MKEKILNYIGKDFSRPDAPDKAAGIACYIHDIELPHMLWGKIKFSEYPHARILHIDTSKAEKLPGVKAVITAFNTPEVRYGFLRDNIALKRDKVRQYRDEVAAVAAIDPDIAEEAVSLIKVEYEPLPAVFSPHDAMKEDAPLIHEKDPAGRPRKNNFLPLKYHHESGDIEAGKKASKFIVSGKYTTQRIQQSCMGTAGCIAEFDMRGNLTMIAKTQIPFLAQRDFNRALSDLGLEGRNTRVIVPTLGGGFGSGLDTHAYEYIAILLAWRTGKPVKILYNRDEEFSYLSPRQCSEVEVQQGCDENGKLTFRYVEVLLDNGAYTSWGATYPSVMMLPATSLYKVSNVYFDAKLVYTNNTYCQAMRGYGNPELSWGLESNMDELALEAGIDPLEFRLINCNEPDETTPMGLKIGTCGLRECIEKSAERISWREKRGKGREKRRGVGIASLIHVGGGGRIYRSDGTGLILKLDDFGNVNVYCGGVEMGQGLWAVLTQTVSEALGVKPEKVFINPVDTGTCPWDVGTHASRGAFMACNAAISACGKLREKIFSYAENIFLEEVTKKIKKQFDEDQFKKPQEFNYVSLIRKDNFDIKDGLVFLKNAPEEKWLTVPLDRIIRAIHFQTGGTMLAEEVFYDPPTELPDWEKGIGNMSASYAFGAQGVEVEVDTDTGEVKILLATSLHDVGKVLNVQTLKGQIYGGLAQGIGYALYENIESQNGKILNSNFRDYKIPTIREMDFPVDIDFVETDDPAGPFGAKGVGEPAMVPTAPAIANAIFDAIGVRIRDLPITPEKILRALGKIH